MNPKCLPFGNRMKVTVLYVKSPLLCLSENIIVEIGMVVFMSYKTTRVLFSLMFLLLYDSGACICEQCSKDKVRIPKFDEYALFRVCNHCSKELKEQRNYGFQADMEP